MGVASGITGTDQKVIGVPEPGPLRSRSTAAGCDGSSIYRSTPGAIVPASPGFNRAVLAFVGLGVLLRVGHYLADYPLWGDEAFLALSFLRRGYLDLLRRSNMDRSAQSSFSGRS